MNLPPWNQVIKNLGNFNIDVSDKISRFKKNHNLLNKMIETSFYILPFPLNEIAKTMYGYFEGTPEEKSEQILHYFESLKSQGQEHYEQIASQLDGIQIDLQDIKQNSAKESTLNLIQDILVSHNDVVEQKIEFLKNDLKQLDVKIDKIQETTIDTNQKVTQLQTELRQYLTNGKEELQRLEIPEKITSQTRITIPDSKIQKLDQYNEKIKSITAELEKLNQQPEIDFDYLLKNSNAYFFAQQFDKALEGYDDLYEHEPDNVSLLSNKARALNKAGKFDDSIAIYENLIQYEPRNVEAIIGKGNSLMHLGKYQEANATFDRALNFDSKNAMALNGKGQIMQFLNKPKDALKFYDKALKTSPNYLEALVSKGDLLVERGKKRQAKSVYQKIQEIEPENEIAQNFLGDKKSKRFSFSLKRNKQPSPKTQKEKSINGTVRNFQISEEVKDHTSDLAKKMGSLPSITSFEVWTFRIERKDPEGNSLPPVSVQMKGKKFDGFINEGDTVRIDKKWKEGQLLKPKKIFNVSGGIWVKSK